MINVIILEQMIEKYINVKIVFLNKIIYNLIKLQFINLSSGAYLLVFSKFSKVF